MVHTGFEDDFGEALPTADVAVRSSLAAYLPLLFWLPAAAHLY